MNAIPETILRFLRAQWFIGACFVLHVGLRLLLLGAIPLEMHSDAGWYFNRALGIAAGQGYSEAGHPTAFWPVGYPGFLGVLFTVFGSSVLVGQMANLLLSAASFVLVLKLSRHIFQSEDAARLSVLLLTIYPNNIAYVPALLTETYFTFLLLLGAYLLVTRTALPWRLLAGLVFGLAALTKPQMIFLPGILVLLWLLQDREGGRWRRALLSGMLLYAAMATVLVPWAVRNSTVFGETILVSTNSGVTLLTGNNPSADGGYVENDRLVEQRNFTVKDQVASDKRAKALAIQWIKENPTQFIKLIPLKIWTLWAKDGEAEWAYQGGYDDYYRYQTAFRAVRIANQAYYVALVGLFIASVALVWRRLDAQQRPWAMFAYVFALYLTAISTVFSGQPRFHFPVMPWVIMNVGWVLTICIKSLTERLANNPPCRRGL